MERSFWCGGLWITGEGAYHNAHEKRQQDIRKPYGGPWDGTSSAVAQRGGDINFVATVDRAFGNDILFDRQPCWGKGRRCVVLNRILVSRDVRLSIRDQRDSGCRASVNRWTAGGQAIVMRRGVDKCRIGIGDIARVRDPLGRFIGWILYIAAAAIRQIV